MVALTAGFCTVPHIRPIMNARQRTERFDESVAYARAVFNVLFHNRDDHPKNLAWRLAPAFDLTVLTIIGTIFIPLTFLAGVYGMNIPMPEMQWTAAYPVFWAVCLGITGFMLWCFRRRGYRRIIRAPAKVSRTLAKV
ncbi:MAG: HipA domain-containing protein [Chromatiales bacterium]|nr:HipA domain-containing protein [Chromatiales bacterium]